MPIKKNVSHWHLTHTTIVANREDINNIKHSSYQLLPIGDN